MNLVVVALLAGLWASILVPSLLRDRRGRSPLTSVSSFERSMGLLAPERLRHAGDPPGRHVLVLADPDRLTGDAGSGVRRRAATRTSAVQRRRRILVRLAAAASASALLALLGGGVFVVGFVLSAGALIGYVALLAHLRASAQSVRRTVRRLPVADTDRGSEVAAGRSA